jgi:D-psicose/D-tagatose/L-ribulose 3-epimerase
MKYGMNLLIWTDNAADEKFYPYLEKIKEIGYDGVEVPLFDLDKTKLANLGKKLQEIGLECTAVTVRSPDDNPISPDPKVREAGVAKAEEVIDACQVVGAGLLCGPLYAALGEFSGAGPTDDEWKWGVESIRKMTEYGEKAGVKIAVEPLNRFEIYLLNTATDSARFVKEVDHPNCGILYDTFHHHIEAKDVAQEIAAGGDKITHVHISENDRSTPGQGQVHWDRTFEALKKINYNEWMVVEAFGLALPALAAATKIWRPMFETEEKLMADSLAFMKSKWEV